MVLLWFKYEHNTTGWVVVASGISLLLLNFSLASCRPPGTFKGLLEGAGIPGLSHGLCEARLQRD